MNTRAHRTPQQWQDWEDQQTREGRFITPDLARNELIAECMQDALNDGDGRPRPNALAHHLGKHGLVIVEASNWDSVKTSLMVIGSCRGFDANPGKALDMVAEVAHTVLKKMEL